MERDKETVHLDVVAPWMMQFPLSYWFSPQQACVVLSA